MDELERHIADIDKRVAVLEERSEATESRLEKMDILLGKVFERIETLGKRFAEHAIREERDRTKLLWGILVAAAGGVGALVMALLTWALGKL